MKTTGRFPSSNRTDDIHYVLFEPDGPVRAVLQIVHGMSEYMGRYEHFARAMNAQGILVCGHDHLGHGDAALRGYFAPRDGWRCLIEDVRALQRIVKSRRPDAPYVLLGHSMGSFIARLFAAQFGGSLDALIIMGTGAYYPLARPGRLLAKGIAALRGPQHRSPLLNDLVFSGYNERILPRRTDFDWLSRDEAVVDAYIADPKTQFIFTAAGFADLIALQSRANRRDTLRRIPRGIPVLVISGDADPIGGYGKGVTRLYRIWKAAGADVRLKLYPGARHELINETNRGEVYADLAAFVREAAPEAAAADLPVVNIRQVFEDKGRFLPLLLLADEQEDMIARYLGRGDLYVMETEGARDAAAVCVVTDNGDGVFEVKNLAVAPAMRRRGFGRRMLEFVGRAYAGRGHTLLVGTGETPSMLAFYSRCGFAPSHRVPGFFTENYDHPIIEEGVRLVDMVYYKKAL